MPATQTRREREREQRRNSLIDAAERVLSRRGQTMTMDDVALEAEYSKGLLYKYFQNKEDLYAAIGLRAHYQLMAMFESAVDEDATGRQQTAAIGRAYIAFAAEQPMYFEALVAQATAPPSDDDDSYAAACERAADGIIALVQQAIEHGIKDGSIRPEIDPRQAAFLLWGSLHGLVTMATFKNVLQRHHQKPDVFLNDALEFLASCMRST